MGLIKNIGQNMIRTVSTNSENPNSSQTPGKETKKKLLKSADDPRKSKDGIPENFVEKVSAVAEMQKCRDV